MLIREACVEGYWRGAYVCLPFGLGNPVWAKAYSAVCGVTCALMGLLLLWACNEFRPPSGVLTESAGSAYNEIIGQESKNIPDFSSPSVLVENFFVDGTPENLQWYTSKPKDYSSKATKKGGAFYAYINDIPNTFRYVGPGVDMQCKKMFNTQMPFLWKSMETLEFMPCSATHWSVDIKNNTVYYKLADNIIWSDGNLCTADDWVFAAEFSRSKKIVDPVANYKFNKLAVKKISDFCISVHFLDGQSHTEYELLDLTNFKPVSKHFYNGDIPDKWPEKYNRIAEPTTGPYTLTKYDSNNGLKFTKVKNWWAHSYPHFRGVANYDEVFYRIIVGRKNPAFRKFALGMFDIIQLDNPAEWSNAQASANVQEGFVNLWKGHYVPVSGPCGVFFNTKVFPVDNILVRRGLAFALDMDGLISTAFFGERARLHSLGVGQNWGKAKFNNSNIRQPKFNPKKAISFFKKAGYTRLNNNGILVNDNNEELEIEVLFNDTEDRELFGFLYSQALKAGVKLDFRYYKGAFLQKIASKTFQAWWGRLPARQIPDNYNLLHSSFASKKGFENFFGYANPELDFLLEKYNSLELTYFEKAKINQRIEGIVDDAVLMVPSYYKNTLSVMAWKWICFPAWLNMKYQDSLNDPFFGYSWFDGEIEAECKKAKAENKMLEGNTYLLSTRYK